MTVRAPDITQGYPSGGSKIGPAWDSAWEWLRAQGRGWTDGTDLARRVSVNHELAESTVRNLLTSARRAGLLEQTYRAVDVPGRGPRTRTHYRIKHDG